MQNTNSDPSSQNQPNNPTTNNSNTSSQDLKPANVYIDGKPIQEETVIQTPNGGFITLWPGGEVQYNGEGPIYDN